MPFTTTVKYALRKLTGASLISDIDAGFTALADDIDAVMVGISEGPIGSRPTSTGGSPGVLGRLYRATDQGGKLYFDFGTGWTEMGFASSAHEPGDLKATARATAPSGWLMCDGALVSTTTYADLFAAIGHVFNGNVDPGGGQFRVPDLRGRVPVGVDGAATRLSSNDALGQSGGAEMHTLTEGQLPVHNHPDTFAVDNASAVGATYVPHSEDGWQIVGVPGGIGFEGLAQIGGPGVFGYNQLIHGHPLSGVVGNAGGGQSFSKMSPYQIFNWLVKT